MLFLKTMSIIAPFLLVGVTRCRHISYYDNETDLRPIISRTQEHRICAELCMSGLGGEPCGESCVDITPQELPFKSNRTQSLSATRDALTGTTYKARKGLCPYLCDYGLGYPLCQCDNGAGKPLKRPDYFKICYQYCKQYNYQVYGCQPCSLLVHGGAVATLSDVNGNEDEEEFDWGKWCVQKCQIGEGGAACECDLLPMKI